MSILQLFLIFIVGLIVNSAYGAAFVPAPGSPMALRAHPRLHITAATIPKLRDAISTHYKPEYQKYLNWAAAAGTSDRYYSLGRTGHDPLNSPLVHQSFIGALGTVQGINYPISPQSFSRKAIDGFLARLRAGDLLAHDSAMIYDWTYNAMTPSERIEAATIMKTRAIKHDKNLRDSLSNPFINPFPSENMLSSSYYESTFAWYVGLALWGDAIIDSEANQAVVTFNTMMTNYGYLDALNFVAGNEGGVPEWIGYARWHILTHFLNVDGWRTATGYDHISSPKGAIDGNMIRLYPEFIHYVIDPVSRLNKHHWLAMGQSQPDSLSVTDGDAQTQILQMLPYLLLNSGLSKEAGLMRSFIDTYKVPWPKYESGYIFGFLGIARSVSPVAPDTTLQKSRWFKNLGVFAVRTGFSSSSDSTFFVSDSHFSYGGHAGVDVRPGFGLAKFGELIGTQSVAYRGYGNLSRYSGATNANVVTFEGGHVASIPKLTNPLNLQEVATRGGRYEKGGIEQVSKRDGAFYYIRVNRARQFTNMVSHTREYVWIPGSTPSTDSDFLVVYDYTAAPSRPSWIYHVPWQPTVSNFASSQNITTGAGLTDRIGTAYTGSNILVKELNNLGDFKDNDNGTADFTGGTGYHGVAFSQTLLPKQARIEVTRVASFDKNVLKRQGNMTIKSHRWQIAVKPVETAASHVFLHVFETADANLKSKMTSTSLIDAGFVQGAWIERQSLSHSNHAVLFHKHNGIGNQPISYALNGNGLTRHIITGLKPNNNFRITDGGKLIKVQSTESDKELWDYKGVSVNTESGILYFETTLSGAHNFTIEEIGFEGSITPPLPQQRLTVP